MSDNTILEMRNITKKFSGVTALDCVDFSVREGEVHCLIGANGAGKSTLVKIMTGNIHFDSGEIYFCGERFKPRSSHKNRNKIAAIYQELSLIENLSVGENVFLNNYPHTKIGTIDWDKVYKKTAELARKMNLDIDPKTPVEKLNSGLKQITEIMKAIACDAKLIVMDEPSSTLSEKEFGELRRIIEELKSAGITVIYISHHLEELFMVGDRVTVLRDGKFVACEELAHINESQLVSYMTGTSEDDRNIESYRRGEGSDEVVLELQNLCNKRVKNINLSLHKGEILGMYGLVGSGRSETMYSVFGVEPYNSGKIFLHGKEFKPKSTSTAIKNGIGMIPENRALQGMVGLLPVWENIIMASPKNYRKFGFLNYRRIFDASEKYKDRLSIKTSSIKNAIGNLSGGNQQKAIVAKWLSANSDILIIDEPTQGIDVMVKQEIYRIITQAASQGKSIIVISSELNELLSVCNRICVMYDGSQVATVSSEDFRADLILDAAITGRMKK